MSCMLPHLAMATTVPCRLAPRRAAASRKQLRNSIYAISSSPVVLLGGVPKRNINTSTPPLPQCQHQSSQQPSFSSSSPLLRACPLRSSPLLRVTQRQQTQRAAAVASYHSYDHPPAEPSPFSPTERAILSAACAHIPEHGFSPSALALGARDAGFLDISTNLLPDGVFSLIQWHLVSQREALAGRARELFVIVGEENEGESHTGRERWGVGRKVEMLTWERLMGNQMVIRRWQEVRTAQLTPMNH